MKLKNFLDLNIPGGFTLIEAIVYVAILALVLTAVISFHLTLGGSSSKLANLEEVARNRRSAMSTIDYLIRNADGLWRDLNGECTDTVSATPSLALYFSSDEKLPGTCVQNGGGIRIIVGPSENRLQIWCYPNIANNGRHNACAYDRGNVYYLTAPDVAVYNDSWKISISTATSSKDGFPAITTTLGVGKVAGGLSSAMATSTATSTIVLRNEQPYGLISWFPFDDDIAPSAFDDITGRKMTCYTPDLVAGLVDGSGGAWDFVKANSDYCFYSESGSGAAWNDIYAFDGPFTLSAWTQSHYNASGYQEIHIISQVSPTTYGYYYETLKSDASCVGRSWMRVFDTESGYSNLGITPCNTMADLTTYLMTMVFDPAKNTATQYLYKKGVGGISTTTTTGLPTLVPYVANGAFGVSRGGWNGIIDDVRMYNRALTPSEVWALQSQGEN
ncbi:MAG: hypothetical protein C3F02_00195 [Parcubacteria group bacterium]|nr:MAG: hypothetical protein C3F02_00195 [Parcubacteria group bacterium]